MRKVALITGVTGQDGSLLADFLLGKGYEVHGLRLYAATDDMARLRSLRSNPHFHLHYGDMTDGGSLWRIIADLRPDEIYNLGAQSHVGVSFQAPESTADINGIGTLRMLEAIRGLGLQNQTRFYQASSSEMFGNARAPQSEDTPFSPCSPYGISKLFAYWTVRNYRDAHAIHASNGILFNHESPVRGEEFVTRKITRAVAAIAEGTQDTLHIGNLEARRDWGHAQDYVEGMWLMLQQPMPDDYILATGEAHSVRAFAERAFACAGFTILWEGEGVNETGICAKSGRTLIAVDPQFFRPTELHELIGDPRKAQAALGWRPRISFEMLVREMVNADRALLREAREGNSHVLAAE